MRYTIAALPLILAAPAHAASGPFISLQNTNFSVLVAFLLFVGILLYFKVPAMIGGLLDKRAARIREDLDAARRLHEEARALLADYDRKLKDAKDQVARIVANAQTEAQAAAETAKADLARSIQRKLAAAEEQITAAEGAAVREVRERAVTVAIAAAGDVLTKQMTAENAGNLIDAAIAEVGQRLN